MIILSRTDATKIGVAFTVSNLAPVGYTAKMRINGKDYAVSPIVDGYIACVSVPASDVAAMTTDYFFADLCVLRGDGATAVRMMVGGRVVGRALNDVEVNCNVVPVVVMPDFKVPNPLGGATAFPATVRKTTGGVVREYGVDIVDDENGIDLTIERK